MSMKGFSNSVKSRVTEVVADIPETSLLMVVSANTHLRSTIMPSVMSVRVVVSPSQMVRLVI